MEYLRQYVNKLVFIIIDDIKKIYLPTNLAFAALYLPILFLSIFRHHPFLKTSKWFVIIPIVIYLLLFPTCQFVRTIPIYTPVIAAVAFDHAQKACEWILIRQNEFQQWSFCDIHHELYRYFVYTQPVPIKHLNKKKKEIFFTGPVTFDQQLKSLLYLSCNIIKYYILLDVVLYSFHQVFKTDFYDKYFLIRILVNLSTGCIIYFFFMINYEIFRYMLCLLLNRPLELIPDLFQKPYLATSPSDFWSRWHQIFKNTWVELIYKPISRSISFYWPNVPKSINYSISTMCVFLFSGVLHEYLVYVTFDQLSGDQMKFFILQAVAVLIEQALKQKFGQLPIPKSIGFILTYLFNGITGSYFVKPWIPYLTKKEMLKYSLINFIKEHIY